MNSLIINPEKAIDAFVRENYKAPLFANEGEISIVYIEGMNPDLTLNRDRQNEWNDLRMLIRYEGGQHRIIFKAVATTEPGYEATHSKEARKIGGVARITFGFHEHKWIHGYHNFSKTGNRHPALVQRQGAAVMVHRDLDKNFVRTGDRIAPAWGINHHGVLPTARPPKFVGRHSAGCPVGLDWDEHLDFLKLTRTDPRYIKNNQLFYSAWFLPGDQLMKFRFDVA